MRHVACRPRVGHAWITSLKTFPPNKSYSQIRYLELAIENSFWADGMWPPAQPSTGIMKHMLRWILQQPGAQMVFPVFLISVTCPLSRMVAESPAQGKESIPLAFWWLQFMSMKCIYCTSLACDLPLYCPLKDIFLLIISHLGRGLEHVYPCALCPQGVREIRHRIPMGCNLIWWKGKNDAISIEWNVEDTKQQKVTQTRLLLCPRHCADHITGIMLFKPRRL